MMNPSKIGKYTVIRELGRGGMATVFLGHDPHFDREVAIKVLPRQFLHDPNFRVRFEREAKTIASLEHPAIVPVYDFGEQEEQPFIVMRFMPGGSLENRIEHGPLSLSEAQRIMTRLASALEEAHDQGIIHRDLKPANILFDHRGNPYLGDFGIVKLMTDSATLTGTAIIGTPAYMSPEQAQGKMTLDRRSDVYALGTILFEMLTGRQPYLADTPMGLALAQINEPIPEIREINREISPGVQPVLARAMAKDRDDRFPTATAFAQSLQAVEQPGGSLTPVPRSFTPPPRTPTPTPRPAAADSAETRIMDQPPPESGGLSLMWRWILGGLGALILIGGPVLYFQLAGRDDLPATGGEETSIVPNASEQETAVGPEDTPPPESTQASAAVEVEQPTPFATDTPLPTRTPEPEIGGLIGGDAILEAARAGEYAGSVVTIMGVFAEEEKQLFENSIASFEAETGIDIQYESSSAFEGEIQTLVAAGNPPDIGGHPQPGLVADLAVQGAVIDPSLFLGLDYLERQYAPGWIDDSILGNQISGVWFRASVKSLVWYPKDNFVEMGYEIPATWDEMLVLSNQIVADGGTPWCIGIESGSATGWVATDWLEDIMLRTQPPDIYDAWVAGDLPFDSAEIRNALRYMEEIWRNPDFISGGETRIATTSFIESPAGLLTEPPGCWFHRQASFLPSFFPGEFIFGENVDFFKLPAIEPGLGAPVLTAGDIAVMYNDRPEVRAVMAYLATGESMRGWIEQGSIISPHQDSELDWYPAEIERRFAELLLSSPISRFDASDQMPGVVGAGAFWVEMTAWAEGAPTDDILPAIDAAWPR